MPLAIAITAIARALAGQDALKPLSALSRAFTAPQERHHPVNARQSISASSERGCFTLLDSIVKS